MCDFRLFRQFKTLVEMNMKFNLAQEFLPINRNLTNSDSQKNRSVELVQTYKSASTFSWLNIFYTNFCGCFQIKVDGFHQKKGLKGKFRPIRVLQSLRS
jgi:hypothetical protein